MRFASLGGWLKSVRIKVVFPRPDSPKEVAVLQITSE